MGKRKSRAKPAPTKRMDKLDTIFSCPFCNHGSSVESQIDMKNLIGKAACRICDESFSTITALTKVLDIYSEWMDECERVNTVEDDVEHEEEEEEVEEELEEEEEEEEEEEDEDDAMGKRIKNGWPETESEKYKKYL